MFEFVSRINFPIAIAAMKRRVEWKPMQHGLKKESQMQLRGSSELVKSMSEGR